MSIQKRTSSVGGPRPGSGRPKGSKSRVLGLPALALALGAKGTSSAFLRSVMADKDIAMGTRVAAAQALLPYEHRKQPVAMEHTGDLLPPSITFTFD